MVLPFVAGANPFAHQSGFVDIATTMLVFALFASGFNLLFGHVGELSFGHAMFFALGAYTTALYTKGFSVVLFGLQLQHAQTDNMVVALALSLLVGLAWAWFLAQARRAALERDLLLDDHAGVRASDLLHRLQLQRA